MLVIKKIMQCMLVFLSINIAYAEIANQTMDITSCPSAAEIQKLGASTDLAVAQIQGEWIVHATSNFNTNTTWEFGSNHSMCSQCNEQEALKWAPLVFLFYTDRHVSKPIIYNGITICKYTTNSTTDIAVSPAQDINTIKALLDLLNK